MTAPKAPLVVPRRPPSKQIHATNAIVIDYIKA